MISLPHFKLVCAGVALVLLATVGNLLLTAATLQADVHAGIPVGQTGGASDPGKEAIIWAAAGLPWLAVLASTPWLLSRDPELTLNVLATLGPLVIAGSAFALLRPPDSADRPTLSDDRGPLPG